MKRTITSVIAALSLLFIAPQVQATTVTATYTGMVAWGYDQAGLFGAPGSYLTNAAYTAVYKFDPGQGTNQYSSPTNNISYGGSTFGDVSPSLGAVITINGQSLSINGAYSGELLGFVDLTFSRQIHNAYENNTSNFTYSYLQHWVTSSVTSLPASITSPFNYAITNDDLQRTGGPPHPNVNPPINENPPIPADSATFGELFFVTGNSQYDPRYGSYAYAFLSPKTLTVEVSNPNPAAVPIPNVGAGPPGIVFAIGALLAWRRKRKARVEAAA